MSHLLLDIDGVLIRDKVLLDHVKNNVVRYVSKKLPKMKKHDKLNNLLYNTYGHTAIGLEKEFGIDTKDFNDYVYNRYTIAHLYDHIQNDETFKNDAFVLKLLCQANKKISFFSNAPLVWTEPIRECIDLRITNTDGNLKPKLESYLKFGFDEKFIFVDDKLNNLMPVLFLKNWTPIHYSADKVCNDIRVIHNISDLLGSN